MSAVTYYRRKAAGQCVYCGGHDRLMGEVSCAACKQRRCLRDTPHLVTWQQVKATLPLRPPQEPEPLQQIGCCGGKMHAILRNPLRTSCCGRVLALDTN